MTAEIPEALAAILERIAPLGDSPGDVSDPSRNQALTGELADLDLWWRRINTSAQVQEVVLRPSGADPMDCLMTGIEQAERAVDSGVNLLIPAVAASQQVSARTIIALLTKSDSSSVLGQPAGMTDQSWMDQCAQIRDEIAGLRESIGEPLQLLVRLGAEGIAGAVGVLLAGAARATPCLIDGTDTWAAAVIADRLNHRARQWWRSSTSSLDPAWTAARERIDLAPGLPLDLTDEAGWGAQANVALLQLLTR